MKIFLSTILAFLLTISVANAAYTITGTLSTDGSIPKSPESILVEPSGTSAISIDWDSVTGVGGYKVYRLKVKDGETISTTLATTTTETSYTDSGLEDGTYSYQIQPFLGSLEPELSNVLPAGPVIISIPTPAPSPAPPSGGGSGGGGSGGGGGGSITQTTPTPTTLSEAAQKIDTNTDNKIDILDFNVLVVNWSKTESGNTADFDNNGTVDVFDFNLLMTHWTG